MDGDGVLGFVKEHTVIADAKAEKPFEFAAERLHPAGAGLSITVNGFENVEGGLLLDGADFGLHVGPETDLLQAGSVYFADLVHGEAATGHHVLKGQTSAGVLAEVLT